MLRVANVAAPRNVRAFASATDPESIKPATSSMHESSLHHKDNFVMPEIKGLQDLHDALQRDAAKQRQKYGGREPTGDAAAFAVRLPQGTQHDKYSLPSRNLEAPASARQSSTLQDTGSAAILSPRLSSFGLSSNPLRKYSKKEVLTLFRDMDRGGSGIVTKRQAVVTLQKQLQPADMERFLIAAKRLDINTRDTSQMTFGSLLNVFQEANLLLRNPTHSGIRESVCGVMGTDLEVSHKANKADAFVPENMAMEIRLHIGPSEEARFRKNKRAGSVAYTDDDLKAHGFPLAQFTLPETNMSPELIG